MIRPATVRLVISAQFVLCSQLGMSAPPAPFENRVPSFPTYSFAGTVPSEFSTAEGGKLSIVTDRFKEGNSSLRWNWTQPNSTLTFRHDDAFKHLTGEDPDPIVSKWITSSSISGFSIWVYNKTPVDDVLQFEIGDGETVDSRFWMKMNFEGWRLCRALYGRDIAPLGGFPNQQTANTLRIIAPKSLPAGSLWFDDFSPRKEQDVRFVTPNQQVPWVRHPMDEDSKQGDFAKNRWTEDEPGPTSQLDITLPETLQVEQTRVIQRIREETMGEQSRPAPRMIDEKTMNSLRNQHAAHAFIRSGESISGQYGDLKQFWGEAGGVARTYWQAAEQPELQAELLGMFNDYIDLSIQQGHGAGYRLREAFVTAARLMKEPLETSGRWEPLLQRLRKAVSIEDFYNPQAAANADVYNTLLRARMCVIFLEDDDRLVWRDLTALRHWMDRTAVYGGINPDGSLFHHNQTYSGYNLPALWPWVDTLYLLRDSEFLPPVSHLYAYRTVFAVHWYSCVRDSPHTLGGRWREVKKFNGTNLYRKLAEMGSPVLGNQRSEDGAQKTEVDPLMASLYLYDAGLSGKTDEWTEKYAAMGIKPATTSGNLALNYTVASIHRRDDWMVFFRGQRYPFCSGEAYGYQGGNTMGRYINYGHMAIFSAGEPTNAAASGWNPPKGSMGGWNFNFWPGTTSREIPFEALRSQFDVEEWMTRETFAVGTHLNGNGVFGMKLREDEVNAVDPTRIGPVKYWLGEKEYQRRIEASMIDTHFRARKSVFMFDDRIVCLGSGIRSSDAAHRVVTTLLQNYLTPEGEERGQWSEVSGQNDRFPIEKRVEAGEAVWLIDSIGNGYYLPAGHAPLVIERKLQKLPYHTHRNALNEELNSKIDPNEGTTELVFLDHGPAPRDGSYEYCILIRADAERMAALTAEPPYKILQQNEAAHVVYDPASQTTGYAIFEPQFPLEISDSRSLNPASDLRPLTSPILSVDRPCVVMTQPHGDAGLALSVADPYLGTRAALDPAGHQGQRNVGTLVRMVLQGKWNVEQNSHQAKATHLPDGNTLLDIPCYDLLPVTLHLQKG